jgi:archaemetzincin
MKRMAKTPAIALVPIGPVPADLLDYLKAPLSATFGLPCLVPPAIPVPQKAYERRRAQYIGHRILEALAPLRMPAAERVLGLIDADCYAPGLNFVLGQARSHGRDAFIALARLWQSFYGLPEDEARFRQRALKEAAHELGHTYGLQHCPPPGV